MKHKVVFGKRIIKRNFSEPERKVINNVESKEISQPEKLLVRCPSDNRASMKTFVELMENV